MATATNGSVPILEVNDLVKNFIVKSVHGIRTLKETVQAVSGVSFMVKPGQSSPWWGFRSLSTVVRACCVAPPTRIVTTRQELTGMDMGASTSARDMRSFRTRCVARSSHDGRPRDSEPLDIPSGGEPQGRRGSAARAGRVPPIMRSASHTRPAVSANIGVARALALDSRGDRVDERPRLDVSIQAVVVNADGPQSCLASYSYRADSPRKHIPTPRG